MRMIVCNLWGGRVFEPLMKFIEAERDKTDIFLFQEVYDTPSDAKEIQDKVRANLYSEIQQRLVGFNGYSAPTQDDAIGHDWVRDPHLTYGNAAFVRQDGLTVHREGSEFVVRFRNARETDAFSDGRNIQYVDVEKDGKRYMIVNFHGLWNGKGKDDSPERIEQSRRVRAFMDKVEGAKILAGDFNLSPDTESLKMLEEGMMNLIKTYGITTTRSEFYTKPIKFADYVLVSLEITVKSFTVPNVPISDHLPMIVEFE
jgi:endonuclease/exonuclease/phosphatase family metal-dependent hydrolase